MKTGQMVNHEGSRKISCPMRERTHCPQKYVSRMSSTQGQCVHMKKKRIMMLPTSALMWQHHEKNPPLLKKKPKLPAAPVLAVAPCSSASLDDLFSSSFLELADLFFQSTYSLFSVFNFSK